MFLNHLICNATFVLLSDKMQSRKINQRWQRLIEPFNIKHVVEHKAIHRTTKPGRKLQIY